MAPNKVIIQSGAVSKRIAHRHRYKESNLMVELQPKGMNDINGDFVWTRSFYPKTLAQPN